MPQLQNWIKIGALLAFSSAALCCAVLGIHVLAQDNITKAGIATLIMQFNLTDIHLPNPLVRPRIIPARGHLQPFQSEAQSAANLLNTAISAASSKVQGAAGAVTTAISDITNITAINAMIPRNCSLGTKQFCIGFDTNTTCHDLPLNISNIVPEAVMKFVGDEVKSLQPLEGILAKVTLASIQGWVILGLIFILFIILMLACLHFFSFATRLLKLGVCLVSVFCFVFFLFSYLTVHYVQSRIPGFKSIIGVEEGPLGHLSMGVLICAGAIMLLTIVISIFM